MKKTIVYIFFQVILLACSSKEDPINLEVEEQVKTLEQPESTIDYNSIGNWAFHPEQNINFLNLYDLDVAVVNKDLELEEIIEIENNAKENTGVDVFFVHPTILENAPASPETIALSDQPAVLISSTIIAQGGLLAKYGRVFAPRYRQSTGNTYLDGNNSKETQAKVIMESYSDVKAAFLNYLNNYNNGNKMILAGHSQGSYLLSMLLSDVFDKDSSLQDKLVTAALGGMGYVYAEEGSYFGGQFENISLCQEIYECGCVQNWGSYKDGQPYENFVPNSPFFNEELQKYGVINRVMNLEEDWFIMDEDYISENPTSFRYIGLASNTNPNFGYNFVAHDNLYTARIRRDSKTEIGLNVSFTPEIDDLRENNLAIEEIQPLFNFWGYHTKDYAIYLWPLVEQIDAKLANCN